MIYFGTQEWDPPTSLHEMLHAISPKLLEYVPNYTINLIDSTNMTEDDLKRFHTSLGEILAFFKYSDDRKKLETLAETNKANHTLGTKEIDVLNSYLGTDIPQPTSKGGSVTMFTAIEELKKENTKKLIKQAVKKTKKKDNKKAAKKYFQIYLKMVRKAIKDQNMTVEDACDYVEVPKKFRSKILSAVKSSL